LRVSYVRALRLFLIAIIAVVSLSVAINYIQTWRRRIRVVRSAAQILSSEVVRAGESIEYSDYQNGQLRFKIRAEKLLETREGKSLLEGIEGIDMNPDGTVAGRIRSRKAEYNKNQRQAFFSEDVQIDLGQGLLMQTHSLNYDLNGNIGYTDDPFQFQSSQVRGQARGFRYDHVRKDLTLNHDVDFFITRAAIKPDGSAMTEEYHVTSQRGYLARVAQLCRFEGNARLEAAMGILSGDRVEAGFTTDLRQLKSLVCEGNAAFTSREGSEERKLGGDRVIFGIAADGRGLEKIDIHGHASFAAKATDGSQDLSAGRLFFNLDPVRNIPSGIHSEEKVEFRLRRGTEQTLLSGEQLDAGFFPGTSSLQNMHAWGKARMSMLPSANQGKNDLEAEAIHLAFLAHEGRSAVSELVADKDVRWISAGGPAGGDRGGQTRTLDAGFLRMLFSQPDGALASGNASGQVVITGVPTGGKQEIRRMQSDSAQFSFFPGANRLKSFHGEGQVQVFFSRPPSDAGAGEREFRTSSNFITAGFRAADGLADVVSQWGNFVVQDGTRTVTSGRGDYEAVADRLILTEAPRIVDANGTTTGDRMEYSRNDGIFTARSRVRSVLKAGQGGRGGPFAASESGAASVVTAGLMQYWPAESRARYAGNVQLLAEASQLQTDALEIFRGGELIRAEGHVQHIILRRDTAGGRSAAGSSARTVPKSDTPVFVSSDLLEYTEGKRTIRYAGGVTLRSGGMTMTSEALVATLDSGGRQIESGTANGKLQIRQLARTIQGDAADYDLKAGKVVVTGNPALINDPARGKSAAARLTFFTADDRILLENK
jgi:LPS export ABC transporter protein LptC